MRILIRICNPLKEFMQNHSLLWVEGVLDKGVGDHLDIEGGLLNMGVSKGIDTLVGGQAEVLVDNLQLMNAFEILLQKYIIYVFNKLSTLSH